MKRVALLVGTSILFAGCDLDLSGLGSCEYSRDFSDEISASGLDALLADAQAGNLKIEGSSGSNRVRVRARACASSRSASEDIDFALRHNGGQAEVTTYVPNYDNARLDLVIEVPADFDADIYDDSGDIEVDHIRDLWINDGSGDIDARHLSGDVVVYEDGSGDIYVDDIDGDFIVQRDRSGRVDYNNVRGIVQLP